MARKLGTDQSPTFRPYTILYYHIENLCLNYGIIKQ